MCDFRKREVRTFHCQTVFTVRGQIRSEEHEDGDVEKIHEFSLRHLQIIVCPLTSDSASGLTSDLFTLRNY